MGRKMTRELVTEVRRRGRVSASLAAKGLLLKAETLTTYSDLRFGPYGRLDDGKVHRTTRLEASGRTYEVRDLLKAAGFRFDPRRKVWFAGLMTETLELGAKMLRRFAEAA